MLVVFAGCRYGRKRLEVFRSPWVRNDDKLFQPVVAEVIGQCVTVEHKEVLDDPEFNFGKAEFYSVDVHPHCPPTPHYCNASPDKIFAM